MRYAKPITIFFFIELMFLTLLLLLREGFNYIWQIRSVQLVIAAFIVLLALINMALALMEPDSSTESVFLFGASLVICLFIPGLAFFRLGNIWIEALMIVLTLVACLVGYLCIPKTKEEPKLPCRNMPEYVEIIQRAPQQNQSRSEEFIDIKELLVKERVLEVKDKVFETELKQVEDKELDVEKRLAKMEERTRELETQNRIQKAVKQATPKKTFKRSTIKVKKISQTPRYKALQPIVIETTRSKDKYEPLIHNLEEQAKDLVAAEQRITRIENKTASAPKNTKYILVKKPVRGHTHKKTVSKAEAERLLASIDAQAKKLVAAEQRIKTMKAKEAAPKKVEYTITKKTIKPAQKKKMVSKAEAERLLASIDAQAKKLVSAEQRITTIRTKNTEPKKTEYTIVKQPAKSQLHKKTVSKADAERLLASIDAQAKKLVSAEQRYIKKTKTSKF